MNIISKLNNVENFEKFCELSDIVVLSSEFSLRPAINLTIENIKELVAKKNGCKIFVEVDKIFHEFNIKNGQMFVSELEKIGVDGIVYGDLGILNYCIDNKINLELAYDPQTYVTSSKQISFYSDFGVKYFNLSREITIQEVKKILENVDNQEQVWMQGFGLAQMLHSKRPLVKNYEDFEFATYNNKLVLNHEKLSLYDEERDQSYPLICLEDETFIMTPNSISVFEELAKLNKYGLKNLFLDFICQDSDNSLEILSTYANALKLINDKDKLKDYINQNKERVSELAFNGSSLGLLYKKTMYKI